MLHENTWNIPRSQALNVSDGVPYYQRDDYVCNNCGKRCGQPLSSCRVPRDDVQSKNNRDARLAKKKNSNRPRRKMGKKGKFKGRPLILNKNGVYVLDCKRDREQKASQSLDSVKATLKLH